MRVTDLPKPLLAALGALADVRRMPARAVSLGVTVLALADSARREYSELAKRGEQVVAGMFGGSEVPAEVHDVPVPPKVMADESDVVLDVIAHVDDPMDRPRPATEKGPEPIPGYDEMTLGSLRGRLRSLSLDDLQAIQKYEKAHLARQPMITLVEHRLAKLAVT